MIRSVMSEDAPAICDIYNHHVENTIVTFEEHPVSVAEMQERIRKIVDRYPWLILEQEGRVLGYAYACRWKSRSAYRYSVECTIYMAEDATGGGLGKMLYTALLADLKSRPLHCVLAGIALPNPASVALHESLGFQKAAHLKDVGHKFNQWIDVGYWELIFVDNAVAHGYFL
ncbi:MAG: N-acetyltransferase family protein [Calditrichaeota bacterium]|nr:MAG: N-acetyltransferase family protein [Calditrichota bacterium]